MPPPVNPADDPRSANQGYLDAAPSGIDAMRAIKLSLDPNCSLASGVIFPTQ